jgi:hypothetical protein
VRDTGIGADIAVVMTLLRVRPATRAEAKRLQGLPPDIDSVIDRLIARGVLEEHAGEFSYRSPDATVADASRDLAGLLAELPELRGAWQRGAGDDALLMEFVHGHEEQWRAWARDAATSPPRDPLNLYPSLDMLRELIAPEVAEAMAPYLPGIERVRAVLPASAVVAEADRQVVQLMQRAGFQIRLARTIESWVYSDAGVLCAVPVVWGEHPPTSIMIARDPTLRALVAAYAEQVWERAVDFDRPRADWADVLEKLAVGLSDRAIAAAQGVSVRTVERRIADAMEHYGVRTRFELGAAWSLEQVDEG